MARRWFVAASLDAFIDAAETNQEFWRGVRRLARVDALLRARARDVPGAWHLLCLAEDWCSDAVQALPVIARLIEDAPAIDLRVVGRDLNEDLMQAHLTRGTRSIPVVILLDGGFRECGWWGPRPSVLQAWHYEQGPKVEPAERLRYKREWYARDRGVSIAREVLELLETAAGVSGGSSPDATGG
ncbi:MAG: thioredoxin family protein [Gemmatimonadaceae bacterium]|nr:thioredoxin family protein [Gemmatimonadaceae bacterium]